MDRRTAVQLVAVGALAPGYAQPLRFFTAEENVFLDQVMELIIPADSHSPGASAAKTSLFADWMVSHSSEKVQQEWRVGLRELREAAARSTPADALAAAAKAEAPFFTRLKEMTVDGYYTSEIGIHEDLNYQGNTYVPDFHGCDHREHQG
jgi:hypothetical protein